MEKAKLIELIYRCLPYSEQIIDLNISDETDSIRFTWRGDRFRVTDNLLVEMVEGSFLTSDNRAILLEYLLKNGLVVQNANPPTAILER